MSKSNLSQIVVLAAFLAAPLAAHATSPSVSVQAIAGSPVSSHVLADLHGKGVTVNVPSAFGTDSNNNASGSTTGGISNSNSVTGNTGFTNVIQNTGNNSLFQTSTVVNISLSH